MSNAARDESIRQKFRSLVAAENVNAVAKRYGMTRHSVLALASVGPVQAGTLAIARERIAASAGNPEPPPSRVA